MNATHPLDTLMPPGRRRDDSEKPQRRGQNLFFGSEKEKGKNYVLAFDNRHAFRDDKRVVGFRSK